MKLTIRLFIAFIILFMFPEAVEAQIQNTGNIRYKWKTDTTKRLVDLSEIIVVLPRKSFPSIDYPVFLKKEKGLTSFYKHEPVISVAINGQAKAYPLNMLTMHEISNDSLGGIPILPTYCPLCNASIVYDRRLSHQGNDYLLDIEVSGMLRNSDMIMADKQTESWWQQLTGTAIVGELTGAQLNIIPSLVISVNEFFTRYPDGLILSPKTGTKAEEGYGTNPYVYYDSDPGMPYSRFFDHDKLDKRLPPMERVIDIKGKSRYKIYPFSTIKKEGVINDSLDDKSIVIFYQKGTVSVLDSKEITRAKNIGSATVFSAKLDGQVLTFKKKNRRFTDDQTNSTWDITGLCMEGPLKGKELAAERHSNHFAFAWLAFHPESIIYGQEE